MKSVTHLDLGNGARQMWGKDGFNEYVVKGIRNSPEWIEHLQDRLNTVGTHSPFGNPIAAPKVPRVDLGASPAQSARAPEAQNSTGPTISDTSSNRKDARLPDRAKWLDAEMKKRGMTNYELAKVGGPDKNTIASILAGRPVREESLDKVATGLSHRGPVVSRSDIPNS